MGGVGHAEVGYGDGGGAEAGLVADFRGGDDVLGHGRGRGAGDGLLLVLAGNEADGVGLVEVFEEGVLGKGVGPG